MTAACGGKALDSRQRGHGRALGRASLAAIALAASVPFLLPIHRYPIPSFYNEWAAFALFTAALVVLLDRRAWDPLPVPMTAMAPLAFAALIFAQVALGKVAYLAQAVIAAQYLAWAAALVVLGAVLRRECGLPALVRVLALSLLIGAVANSAIALLQHYGDPAALPWWVTRKTGPSVYGNLAQRNQFACHAMLGLLAAAYLTGRGMLKWPTAIPVAALLLTVLALAASRSAFVYLALAAGIAVLDFRRCRDAASRRTVVFMLSAVPGFLAANVFVTLPFMQPEFGVATAAMIRIFDTVGGVAERFEVWREAVWMFLQSPLTGTGFGSFAWYHYLFHVNFDAPLTAGQNFNNAHNIVLQVLAEFGAAGVALLLAAGAALLAGMRRMRAGGEGFFVRAIIVVLAAYSLLEYPLWYAYFLGIGALFAGLAAADWMKLPLARIGRPVAALVLVAACILIAGTAADYRAFEQLFFVRGSPRAVQDDTARFAALMTRLYRAPLLVPYLDLVAAYADPIDVHRLADERATVERAIRFAPYAPAVYRRVLLLALAREDAAMRRAFAAAYKVYPRALPDFLAELKALRGRHPAEVEPLIELATAKLRGYAAARGALRQ